MKRVLTMAVAAIWRDWLAAAVAVVSAHPAPPVGTPSPVHHEGNSAPARALVAGAGKSERTGERGGEK